MSKSFDVKFITVLYTIKTILFSILTVLYIKALYITVKFNIIKTVNSFMKQTYN